MPAKFGKKDIQTPKGNVNVEFVKDGSAAKITFNGKTVEVPIKNSNNRIQVKLPQ
jgi:hypothetical protein